MPRLHPEQDFQETVANYLKWALPPQVFFTSIAHGGGGRLRGAMLKKTGMKAGVPDILIVWRGRPVFLEIKTRGVYLSAVQKEIHTEIVLAGGVVTVIRSLEELVDFLEVLGVPLQARLTPAERAVRRVTALGRPGSTSA